VGVTNRLRYISHVSNINREPSSWCVTAYICFYKNLNATSQPQKTHNLWKNRSTCMWPHWLNQECGELKRAFKPGLRKTRVFKKKTTHLGFFEKKQDLVPFLRKMEKPYSSLFLLHHALSLFSVLHNNNLLYLLCHSNLKVKECTPSLFLQIFGQFTPKW